MTLDEKVAVLGGRIEVPRLGIKGTGIGEALSGVLLGTLYEPLIADAMANSNERGRYGSSSDFDMRLFREYDSVPFRMGVVEGGAKSYMTSYNAWNKVPMTSHPVIRDITMKEWGVDGADVHRRHRAAGECGADGGLQRDAALHGVAARGHHEEGRCGCHRQLRSRQLQWRGGGGGPQVRRRHRHRRQPSAVRAIQG